MSDLRQAAFDGDLQAVKKLHKEDKAKINQAGPRTQRTPLHWAVQKCHNQVVSYLLKGAKAFVDPIDNDGNTPLNLIIQTPGPLNKKMGIMAELISEGADCTIPNDHGQTPLMNLIPLRNQIISNYPHLREGLNNLIRKIKENIHEKGRQLNRSVSIQPNGEVALDKTVIHLFDPRNMMPTLRMG